MRSNLTEAQEREAAHRAASRRPPHLIQAPAPVRGRPADMDEQAGRVRLPSPDAGLFDEVGT